MNGFIFTVTEPEPEEEIEKTLVVYYSASGNTETVAEYIAKAANDFTGKTVIPFCTSTSSGLGESGELLEETAGTGNWLEGQRFSSGSSQEELQAWVDSLALQ